MGGETSTLREAGGGNYGQAHAGKAHMLAIIVRQHVKSDLGHQRRSRRVTSISALSPESRHAADRRRSPV
jgi:hypothetical protein